MKSLLNRIAIALLVASLSSVMVFAKARKVTINFLTSTKVNGTVVKKGTYEVKFDDKTGELSILKNSKVVARANASAEKRDSKAQQFTFRTSEIGGDVQLVSVTFDGADHDLVIGGAQASR